MENLILIDALKVLSDRRIFAEHVARQNKEKALKDKAFNALHTAYVDAMINCARTGKDSNDPLIVETKKAYEEKLKLLNIGPIEAQYTCTKCCDTGYIDGNRCSCLNREITKQLIKDSGFSDLKSFNNISFSIFKEPDKIKKIYSKMQDWCNSNFKKNMVLLSGNTGVGKTYLAMCMANALIEKGHVVNITTAFAMESDFVASNIGYTNIEKDKFNTKYLTCEFLIIDDLGTELRKNSITNSCIYVVLNERKMRGLKTIITTNLTLSDISQYYDERITSRIADENTIKIRLDGEDLRLKQKN